MKDRFATIILGSTFLATTAAAGDLPLLQWNAILYTGGPSSVAVSDFDRNGTQDVAISAIELGRVYIEFQGSPNWLLTLDENFDKACAVRAADVNSDGWTDVVASQRDDANGMVKWWRNPGNGGGIWSSFIVENADFSQARSLAVGDLDKDGDADIVVAGIAGALSYISWYENTDGSGTTWTHRDVATGAASSFLGPHDVVIADLDGDGNADVGAVAYDSDEVA